VGRFTGKVAFITGVARGQGRSHALRLASEGAEIIGCDLCEQIDTVQYPLATEEDLRETASAVEALDRRIVTRVADVRDPAQMQSVVADGLAELGRIDIVVANAGISPHALEEADPIKVFADTVAVNLMGVRHSVHAAIPAMLERGEGGSIVLISSTQGLSGSAGNGAGATDGYVASKHGVVGLMRTWANWLGPQNIRVNTIHPTGVKTTMIENDAIGALIAQNPDIAVAFSNLLPVDALEPEDISAAVAWLASDDARYVTGVTLPVDAGNQAK
jgi:SDR family mycofactocin-dependent oxidoreductase